MVVPRAARRPRDDRRPATWPGLVTAVLDAPMWQAHCALDALAGQVPSWSALVDLLDAQAALVEACEDTIATTCVAEPTEVTWPPGGDDMPLDPDRHDALDCPTFLNERASITHLRECAYPGTAAGTSTQLRPWCPAAPARRRAQATELLARLDAAADQLAAALTGQVPSWAASLPPKTPDRPAPPGPCGRGGHLQVAALDITCADADAFHGDAGSWHGEGCRRLRAVLRVWAHRRLAQDPTLVLLCAPPEVIAWWASSRADAVRTAVQVPAGSSPDAVVELLDVAVVLAGDALARWGAMQDLPETLEGGLLTRLGQCVQAAALLAQLPHAVPAPPAAVVPVG